MNEQIITFALAVAAVSLTVTKSSIFQPLRDRWEGIPFLGKLVQCPYCFSHWVAMGLVALHVTDPMEWFILSFAVIGLTAIISGVILWLFNHAEGAE